MDGTWFTLGGDVKQDNRYWYSRNSHSVRKV